MIGNMDPKMLKVLFNAASGHKVYVSAPTELRARYSFKRYVNTLDRIGLERDLWTAHSSNGRRFIRFESGGEVRFESRSINRISGVNLEQVVFDE